MQHLSPDDSIACQVTLSAACCNDVMIDVQAAGGAFSILFKGGTGGAVDSIIPTLLHGLDGNAKQSAQVTSCFHA